MPSEMRLMSILMLVVCLQLACSSGDDDEEGGVLKPGEGYRDPAIYNDAGPASDEPLSGVFIQPYKSCEPPVEGDTLPSDDGEVCTNVAISGATEEGRLFTDYADCDVVLSQRPYWPGDPDSVTASDDPRLSDEAYMAEIQWLTDQVRSAGCICCHDSAADRDASGWDVAEEGIWLDGLRDEGLAILSGAVGSEILGAYSAEQNNGFDRDTVGLPTTDIERASAILDQELTRRGVGDEEIAQMEEFGGFLLDILDEPSKACGEGEGIDAGGIITWEGGGARYIYVMTPEAKNPGVPPNNDTPEGTLWRMDVKSNYEAVESGMLYGALTPGSHQVIPASGLAPDLKRGQQYKLYVLKDILSPRANCLFTLE